MARNFADQFDEHVKVAEKKKLFRFKKPPQLDEDGNPVYVRKRKLFKAHRLNRSFSGDLALTLVLGIGGIFMLFPAIYAVSNSLKPLHELWLFPPNLIVRNPTFTHYVDLFNFMGNSMVPMSKYFFNSIYICLLCTAVTTLSSSMCAYAISKRNFKGKNALFKLIETAMMFVAPASGILSYVIISQFDPIDHYWPIVLPYAANSLYMYIVKNFMDTFPTSVLEAARIDGAGEFRIFWKILMPGCKPAWMTVILFAVQGTWAIGTGVYVYKEEMKGIMAGLDAITSVNLNRTGVSSAMSILLMIVPLITFIVTQSNVMNTMSSGGMKD